MVILIVIQNVMNAGLCFVLFFIAKISLTLAYCAEFIKIENCSTSNGALDIERCDIVDGKFNFIYTYKRSYIKDFVSWQHFES
jgi:hypothetical protein